MILDLSAVVKDGTKPAGTIPQRVPLVQDIEWPRAEDGTLKLAFVKQDGTAYNLSGLVTIVFAVRKRHYDEAVLISRQASITNAAGGLAEVALVAGDTFALVEGEEYHYDVQLTDVASKRWQVVTYSEFRIAEIVARPGDPVTIPIPSSPTTIGPAFLDLGVADSDTDGLTTEQLAEERVVNFDDLTSVLPNLLARLDALLWVTGGIGTARVRWGGSIGAADGTLILTSDPITGTTPAAAFKSGTVAKPTGAQLLKVTLQNDTAGQMTRMRAGVLSARGAA